MLTITVTWNCIRGLYLWNFNTLYLHALRSPKSRKRKAITDKTEAASSVAKKAKTSKSSSSEASSTEEDEASAKVKKATPAGNIAVLFELLICLFWNHYKTVSLSTAKAVPVKAVATKPVPTKAASSSSEESSDSEEEKAPAKVGAI